MECQSIIVINATCENEARTMLGEVIKRLLTVGSLTQEEDVLINGTHGGFIVINGTDSRYNKARTNDLSPNFNEKLEEDNIPEGDIWDHWNNLNETNKNYWTRIAPIGRTGAWYFIHHKGKRPTRNQQSEDYNRLRKTGKE